MHFYRLLAGGAKASKSDTMMDAVPSGGAAGTADWNYGPSATAAVASMDTTEGAPAPASHAAQLGGDGAAGKTIGKFGVVVGCASVLKVVCSIPEFVHLRFQNLNSMSCSSCIFFPRRCEGNNSFYVGA